MLFQKMGEAQSVSRAFLAMFLIIFSVGEFSYGKKAPYAFIHEYGRLVEYNPEICNVTATFFKFNRTSGVMNTTWTLNKDQSNVTLHAVGYQFLNNEFRKSVIDLTLPFCDFLNGERTDFDAQNILHKCGEVKSCPLRKGDVIRLCNISPQPSQFPPFLPRGRWSIRLTLLSDDNVVAGTIEWIVQIVDINQV